MTSLSKIRTRADLEYFSSDLEELREKVFKIKDGSVVDIPVFIRDEFLSSADKNVFLDKVKQELASARFLEITTAVNLDEFRVQRISDWAKANLGQDVLIDLKVDPSLVAGVKMSFNGRFKDASLREEFEREIDQAINK